MLMLAGQATRMLADEQLNRSSIDPGRLLSVHQQSREQGCRCVSFIVGAASTARAVWGGWLAAHFGCVEPWMPTLIVPGVDQVKAQDAIRFAVRDFGERFQRVPVLFVPGKVELESAVQTARNLLGEVPGTPIAIVADPSMVMGFLKSHKEAQDEVRAAVLGGLVVLDQHVEAVLNRTLLSSSERPLYAISHASALGESLNRAFGQDVRFEIGKRVRGRSGVMHHVDLMCTRKRLGIQIDDAQGLSNEKQRARDQLIRDDLSASGLQILSINAFEIMADLPWVIGRVAKLTNQQDVSD